MLPRELHVKQVSNIVHRTSRLVAGFEASDGAHLVIGLGVVAGFVRGIFGGVLYDVF